MQLTTIARRLAQAAGALRFAAPVHTVYNPLEYAWRPYREYLQRYGASPKEVLLLGMNPGPFGMAQTGIPFGEVAAVRDWLHIEEPVGRPAHEHPRRPIEGFACPRSEVSGQRVWAWARMRFGTPERFFGRFFVGNYCPLAFLEDTGRNRTPDKLPPAERVALFAVCDEALRLTVEVLRPSLVVGVGAFAENRARAALADLPVAFGRILHPSPASPIANRGWSERAEQELRALGVSL